MVPRTVLSRSGPVSVNTVQPRTTMNNTGPMKNPKASVLSAVKGNKGNAVKASACWVWRPKHKVLDHVINSKILKDNRSGPNWLFDIDALTNSMNYKPVVVGNQSNGNADTKSCDDADPPFSSSPKDSPDAGFKPLREEEKKDVEDTRNEGGNPSEEGERVDQEKDANVNSTNNNNTVSPTVNAAGIEDNAIYENIVYRCVDDLNMPDLEEISRCSDAENDDSGADINILDTYFRVVQALKDPSWIEAMQEELLQFKLQEVWTLVELPNGKRAIGTKWVFRNKNDERGIVIKNKARLVAQGYTQEEGIDYDEVFAAIARIKAIRLFLAYASYKDFVVYQMDVKSAFLYGKIEEEVYVCQPLRFEDPDFPNRVYKVEKALYGLHQAPRAWYETLSTYLLDNGFQRGKIDKTLFIRRDKGDILLVQVYVDDIIFGSTKKSLCTEFEKMMHKKFQMSSIGELTFFLGLQTTSTPMETQKPLLKDEDGEEVDVYLYRSMIGSLMYLTSSRPNIMLQCMPVQDTKKQKSRRTKEKDTEIPHSSITSDPTNIADEAVNKEPSMQLKELTDFCTKFQQRVLELENTNTAQAQEITCLKKRVKKLEKKGGSRTHKLKRLYTVGRSRRVVSSEEESLDEDMFGANDLEGDEVVVKSEVADKDVNLSVDEVTLAQALAALKSAKVSIVIPTTAATTITVVSSRPRAKWIVFHEQEQEQEQAPTTILLKLDEELAFKLQAEEDEEERLAREKAQKVEEDNIAWDDIQAKVEVDYQFGSKTASSRARRIVDDDKETEELKQCMKIISDDGDDVTIEAIPLSTKSPTIVDYKIYKEGKKSYFKIIRADGNSQMYLTFGKMLKNFDKEDLEVLWSIFKARFKKTEPVNYMDIFLHLNLKTMFEHHLEDSVWKNQQGLVKVLNWKLYDSCGVHCVTMQNILYYLLVEKILVKKQLKEGYVPQSSVWKHPPGD
ncbi:putative ribonuclease H-like domain-containing protein [Tanacetum coccineum]